MDRNTALNSLLKQPHKCAIIKAGYVRIVHPITKRFVAEYDPLRDILFVTDRGETGLIDLARLRQEAAAAAE